MEFELIKQRRTAKMTQAELAAKAEIHPVTLSRVECGHQVPDESTRERLASALGVPVRDLFPEPEAPAPSAVA